MGEAAAGGSCAEEPPDGMEELAWHMGTKFWMAGEASASPVLFIMVWKTLASEDAMAAAVKTFSSKQCLAL
jgi:hypothetical protein